MNFKTKKEKEKFFSENCLPKNSKFQILYENNFFKQVKKHIKTQKDILIICDIIKQFSTKGILPEKYKPHNLKGTLKEYKEAHIKNDILIIWKKEQNKIIIITLGTHSELFN